MPARGRNRTQGPWWLCGADPRKAMTLVKKLFGTHQEVTRSKQTRGIQEWSRSRSSSRQSSLRASITTGKLSTKKSSVTHLSGWNVAAITAAITALGAFIFAYASNKAQSQKINQSDLEHLVAEFLKPETLEKLLPKSILNQLGNIGAASQVLKEYLFNKIITNPEFYTKVLKALRGLNAIKFAEAYNQLANKLPLLSTVTLSITAIDSARRLYYSCISKRPQTKCKTATFILAVPMLTATTMLLAYLLKPNENKIQQLENFFPSNSTPALNSGLGQSCYNLTDTNPSALIGTGFVNCGLDRLGEAAYADALTEYSPAKLIIVGVVFLALAFLAVYKNYQEETTKEELHKARAKASQVDLEAQTQRQQTARRVAAATGSVTARRTAPTSQHQQTTALPKNSIVITTLINKIDRAATYSKSTEILENCFKKLKQYLEKAKQQDITTWKQDIQTLGEKLGGAALGLWNTFEAHPNAKAEDKKKIKAVMEKLVGGLNGIPFVNNDTPVFRRLSNAAMQTNPLRASNNQLTAVAGAGAGSGVGATGSSQQSQSSNSLAQRLSPFKSKTSTSRTRKGTHRGRPSPRRQQAAVAQQQDNLQAQASANQALEQQLKRINIFLQKTPINQLSTIKLLEFAKMLKKLFNDFNRSVLKNNEGRKTEYLSNGIYPFIEPVAKRLIQLHPINDSGEITYYEDVQPCHIEELLEILETASFKHKLKDLKDKLAQLKKTCNNEDSEEEEKKEEDVDNSSTTASGHSRTRRIDLRKTDLTAARRKQRKQRSGASQASTTPAALHSATAAGRRAGTSAAGRGAGAPRRTTASPGQ